MVDEDAFRVAFMTGWWVNAALPTEDEPVNMEYLKNCAELDYLAYRAGCLATRDAEGFWVDNKGVRIQQ